MNKKQQLNTWIDTHKSLPLQGSTEWLNGRKFRIGGSEISVIEGVNPYVTKKDLVAQHLGLTQFQGNPATRWGKILEEITVTTLGILFNCSIHVPGSVPHSEVDVHANSADGVAYIPTWNMIIMFEVKNPSRRIPGGTIPKQYKSQIKSGLDTIRICDFAIFADHMQRKCELDDLRPNNRSYDTNHHNIERDRVCNDPIMLTMIGIYSSDEIWSDERQDIIDYGEVKTEIFDDMLLSVDDKKIWSVHYGAIYICDNVNNAPNPKDWRDNFMSFCKTSNYKPIGILPLKTFRLSLIPLYPEPNYIINMRDDINAVVQVIKDLDGLDPLIQKVKLDKLYDDPSIRKNTANIIARKRAMCGTPLCLIEQRLNELPDSKPSDTLESTEE